MRPLALITLPGEVLSGLASLPLVADRLAEVVESTDELRAMRVGIDAIHADTTRIAAGVGEMATGVQHVPGIADSVAALAPVQATLARMDERMATIEAAMPVLVEVQQHLGALPETMEGLDSQMAGLGAVLERLLESIAALSGDIGTLQAALAPVGRIAGRLPGGRAGRNARSEDHPVDER